MEIRVLDFEILTKHYLNYQLGTEEIKKVKDKFIERLTPLKNEMESIFKMAQSGIVVDNSTEKSRNERFQQLQNEAHEIDLEFQSQMKEMRNNLNETSFNELEVIVTTWSKENKIDLVTGKMEVIFVDDKYNATNDILEVLKKMELYVDN